MYANVTMDGRLTTAQFQFLTSFNIILMALFLLVNFQGYLTIRVTITRTEYDLFFLLNAIS